MLLRTILCGSDAQDDPRPTVNRLIEHENLNPQRRCFAESK